jgi:hypothetical protein
MANDFCEHLMRVILGLLSGVVGMLAGWAGLAFLVVALAGPDRDGGIAMGAFFNIGPIGAVIGFAAGIFLFVKFGLVARPLAAAAQAPLQPAGQPPASAEPTGMPPPGVAVAPGARRISRPFAVVLLAMVGTLAWWGWYEFIRSPYLTHGDMTLALQFRLPEGAAAPADPKDVEILLDEGIRAATRSFSRPFRCRTRRTGGPSLSRCPGCPRRPGSSIFRAIPIPRRATRIGFHRAARPTRST